MVVCLFVGNQVSQNRGGQKGTKTSGHLSPQCQVKPNKKCLMVLSGAQNNQEIEPDSEKQEQPGTGSLRLVAVWKKSRLNMWKKVEVQRKLEILNKSEGTGGLEMLIHLFLLSHTSYRDLCWKCLHKRTPLNGEKKSTNFYPQKIPLVDYIQYKMKCHELLGIF